MLSINLFAKKKISRSDGSSRNSSSNNNSGSVVVVIVTVVVAIVDECTTMGSVPRVSFYSATLEGARTRRLYYNVLDGVPLHKWDSI